MVSEAQKNFNSHAHVERDTIKKSVSHFRMNFNSHAHVERDAQALTWSDKRHISTHTLTWSVTRFITLALSSYKNFNSHAHVERDLANCVISSPTFTNFNSHAHVERDV